MSDLLDMTLNKPKVMGILNITPDSFSDGGNFLSVTHAVEHARKLILEGADILDIGGESTRPGAAKVTVEEELSRIVPVIEAIRQFSNIPLSIDTSKTPVMAAGLAAGANIINDVNALRAEGAVALAAKAGVPVCLMHMQGAPRTMQHNPEYTDVVTDVCHFLQSRVDECVVAGIEKNNIWLDPGIGFGKNLEHNQLLLKQIKQLVKLGYPILIGVSRKSMFGHWLQRDTADRMVPSIIAGLWAMTQGAAILRVHDVQATRDAIVVWQTLSAE